MSDITLRLEDREELIKLIDGVADGIAKFADASYELDNYIHTTTLAGTPVSKEAETHFESVHNMMKMLISMRINGYKIANLEAETMNAVSGTDIEKIDAESRGMDMPTKAYKLNIALEENTTGSLTISKSRVEEMLPRLYKDINSGFIETIASLKSLFAEPSNAMEQELADNLPKIQEAYNSYLGGTSTLVENLSKAVSISDKILNATLAGLKSRDVETSAKQTETDKVNKAIEEASCESL